MYQPHLNSLEDHWHWYLLRLTGGGPVAGGGLGICILKGAPRDGWTHWTSELQVKGSARGSLALPPSPYSQLQPRRHFSSSWRKSVKIGTPLNTIKTLWAKSSTASCVENQQFLFFLSFEDSLMWTIFKSFYWICYNIASGFVFMFWFSGCGACEILAPRPGFRAFNPCIRQQSLNRWAAREVPHFLMAS